jgi:hypothetical protein
MVVAMHIYSPKRKSWHSRRVIAKKGPVKNGDEAIKFSDSGTRRRHTGGVGANRTSLRWVLDHYSKTHQPGGGDY